MQKEETEKKNYSVKDRQRKKKNPEFEKCELFRWRII